jgi:hypothetical protein
MSCIRDRFFAVWRHAVQARAIIAGCIKLQYARSPVREAGGVVSNSVHGSVLLPGNFDQG